MGLETNKIITATSTLTTFRKFKELILDLLRGYPAYVYFGKFESIFTKNGEKVVDLLIRHDIIEQISKKEVQKRIETLTPEELGKLPQGERRFFWYRLKPRGVDLSISMINLDYSEKVLKYSKEMSKFTKVIIIATLGALFFAFAQAIISLWF